MYATVGMRERGKWRVSLPLWLRGGLTRVLAALIAWLRHLFFLSPKCAVVSLPDGKLRDVLLHSEEEARAIAQKLHFPKSFAFGAATAAYQIEGGIGDTNWSRWERQKIRTSDGGETVANGEHAGDACDSWNRFEDDFRVIRELGLKCYRFSIEWSRVEPVEGRYKEDVVSPPPTKLWAFPSNLSVSLNDPTWQIERYALWCKRLRMEGVEVR